MPTQLVLRALDHCTVPSSAAQCQRPGDDQRPLAGGAVRRSGFGKKPVFTGAEAPTPGWSTPREAMRLFGYPRVPLARLIDWTADWVARGMPSLGKDTHFDTRDGAF